MDNKQITTELRKLAKTCKHEEVADLQALAAHLRELGEFNAREVKLLVDAAKADVLEDLSAPRDGGVQSLLRERLASRMTSESDATSDEARWAVETWAKALSGKSSAVSHAQPARPALSWDDDESGKAARLSDLRANAPAPMPGNALPAQARFSPQPAQQKPAASSWPPPALTYASSVVDENTSGTDGPVPEPICSFRWNWGAFCLGWLWVAANIRFLYGILLLFVNLIPGGQLVVLGVSIALGLKGHQLAWRHRRFESVEQYVAVQRAWMYWGIALTSVVFAILIAAFVTGAIHGYEEGRAAAQWQAAHPGR